MIKFPQKYTFFLAKVVHQDENSLGPVSHDSTPGSSSRAGEESAFNLAMKDILSHDIVSLSVTQGGEVPMEVKTGTETPIALDGSDGDHSGENDVREDAFENGTITTDGSRESGDGESTNRKTNTRLSWLSFATKHLVYLFDILSLGKEAFDRGIAEICERSEISSVRL